MKNNNLVLAAIFSISLFALSGAFAQTLTPTPESQTPEVSREKREQAYAKLLEAQRFFWTMKRTRSQTVLVNSLKSAKQALQKAIELNPNLAEAYTTLAELNVVIIPGDKDEALLLAGIASKINPDNFGARLILAQVYTEKSQINTGQLELITAQKAIAEWKEITRLDPRNAEAWAFLSVFYERQNKNEERIEALKKWLAAAAPIESSFYRRVFGRSEDLSPENAAVKLGDALIKAGKSGEAVEILSRTIADNPDNLLAIDFLRQAIQGIADVITTTGHVNVDFADVRTIMSHTGRAVMGMGVARGTNRAIEAAQKAICSPLLEEGSVEGARGVLLNITGGPNMSLHEIEEAATIVQQTADPEANIIVGQVINPDMGDDLVVTVIATGFEREEQAAPIPVAAARSTRNGQQVATGVGASMGDRSYVDRPLKDLDRPSFLRRPSDSRESMERVAVVADDEWDVPTFLRKQVD